MRRLTGNSTSGFFIGGGGLWFLEAILSNVAGYVTTYALIGLRVIAIGLLVYLGGNANRLIAVWTACAYLFHAFNIIASTDE